MCWNILILKPSNPDDITSQSGAWEHSFYKIIILADLLFFPKK
ncbi:hypothetical protein Hanom_Chr16g01457731 [Helianthus anomalus]